MSSKTCYFPDRSIDAESTPCNLAAEDSHCCRVGQMCLDNGYCIGGRSWGNVLTENPARIRRGQARPARFIVPRVSTVAGGAG